MCKITIMIVGQDEAIFKQPILLNTKMRTGPNHGKSPYLPKDDRGGCCFIDQFIHYYLATWFDLTH